MLTDKYAEGYPAGAIMAAVNISILLRILPVTGAKKLFNAKHVNVQPHSGSNANLAVFMTLLKPGATIMGMDLSHGGHLTHGSKVNFSGQLYNALSYGVSEETELIDYDNLQKLAEKHKPELIIAGASAYPRTLDFERFRAIADSVGAFFMADMAHIAGLVATELHPSPIPHAHFTTSTTHKTLRGPRGGIILMGEDGENSLGLTAKGGRTKNWSEVLDSTVMPGLQGGPLMHIIAAKAAAFLEALTPEFSLYQQQVVRNAQTLAAHFTDEGIRVVSGGTDNHLMILDLTELKITGKEAEAMLDKAHITVNKNVIPFETQSPLVSSGIRIGTPAITSRGMVEGDMRSVSEFIVAALKSKGDENVIARVGEAVKDFTTRFSRRA